MIEKTMDNPGERLTAARRHRYHRMIAVYVAVAVVILIGSWFFHRGDGEIAPAWAITLSLLYVGTLILGGWWMGHHTDEVEHKENLFAASFAAAFYGLAFPVWFFLAKAQLAPEPNQLVLFGAFVLMAAVGYTFKKLT